MGLAEIFALIQGVIKFPDAVLSFVKLLQKTPEEKHEAILENIQLESKTFDETGRPSWH